MTNLNDSSNFLGFWENTDGGLALGLSQNFGDQECNAMLTLPQSAFLSCLKFWTHPLHFTVCFAPLPALYLFF
jgi:hypothetical protein